MSDVFDDDPVAIAPEAFALQTVDATSSAPPSFAGARSWSFSIPGEPVAKGRPRLGVANGHAMAFTPAKTRRYEDIVRQTAIREWRGATLIEGPVSLVLGFYRSVPTSWPKGRRGMALRGEVRPTSKPDLDNLVKSITDGLNGVVYIDDSQIVSINAAKHYAQAPIVVATLTW